MASGGNEQVVYLLLEQEQSSTFSFRSFWIYLISLLGSAGTGLQNYMALFSFLGSITRFTWDVLQGLAISLGGICSGLVNFCMNLDLLNSFMNRIYPVDKEAIEKQNTRKQYHAQILKGWTKVQYWAGIGVFIITGILFGSTAFSFVSFGALGVFTLISIAAGLFVSMIMIIQEVETWLSAFDPPKGWKASDSIPEEAQFSLKQLPQDVMNWFKKKSVGEWIGLVIAVGNVLALSLLFTLGLAGLLVTLGAPPLAAVVSGFCIAFTIGAFTEYYFYNHFMSKFCHKMQKPDEIYGGDETTLSTDVKKSKWKVLGVFSVLANASVNGALCYSGILLLNPLLIAAGLSAIPLPVIIIAAVFGGLASLLLGADFWIKNANTLVEWIMGKEKPESLKGLEPSSESTKTDAQQSDKAPLLPAKPDSELEQPSTNLGFAV